MSQTHALDLADPSTDPFAVAQAAADVIRERTDGAAHDVALVLGSGWGQTGDLIGETFATIENTDVPGFGKAAVAGHSGVMRSVGIGDTGRRALVYGTRTHFYEGKGVRAVVHNIRTAAALGCRTVVITNGCGGLREEWAPGMAQSFDHLVRRMLADGWQPAGRSGGQPWELAFRRGRPAGRWADG